MIKTIKEELTPQDVSRETMEKFMEYHRILSTWNKTISLMKNLSWDEFYHRHIRDVIQIKNIIEYSFIDLGSGAGVPAIPLLILGKSGMLIESNKKKSIFLSQTIKRLSLKEGVIINDRIENTKLDGKPTFTSKALASLSILLNFLHSVSRETVGVFHKGKKIEEEIKEAQEEWLFDYDLYRSISNREGAIIKVSNIRKKTQ